MVDRSSAQNVDPGSNLTILGSLIQAAAPGIRRAFQAVKSWLVDAGCGHDLIAKSVVPQFNLPTFGAPFPLIFNTANGQAPAKDMVSVPCSEAGGASIRTFSLRLRR